MIRGCCWRDYACSVSPLTPLNCVANRHHGGSVPNFEIAWSQLRHIFELLDNLRCILVPTTLQVGVYQIIHGVQLFSAIPLLMRGILCRKVGGDGVVPQAESREYMRGHVQCVRR